MQRLDSYRDKLSEVRFKPFGEPGPSHHPVFLCIDGNPADPESDLNRLQPLYKAEEL